MRIPCERLSHELKKNLASVYLVSGEEPLLQQEACDAIHHQAIASGFSEKQIINIKTNADWQDLQIAYTARSLFDDKKRLEVRVQQKINKSNSKIIQQLLSEIQADNLLLFRFEKLESRELTAAWVKAIDKIGVVITIYPLPTHQLPAWLQTRSQSLGLILEPEAIQCLAEFVQGNLLAAKQELDKLKLLANDKNISAEQVIEYCHDNARYGLFELIDTALAQNEQSIAKILEQLQLEGETPVLVLWAITRQIRELAKMAHQLQQGQSLDTVLNEFRVWKMRKPIISRALQRHSAAYWQQSLLLAQHLDGQIKGLHPGNPWQSLLHLCLRLAGKNLARKRVST